MFDSLSLLQHVKKMFPGQLEGNGSSPLHQLFLALVAQGLPRKNLTWNFGWSACLGASSLANNIPHCFRQVTHFFVGIVLHAVLVGLLSAIHRQC